MVLNLKLLFMESLLYFRNLLTALNALLISVFLSRYNLPIIKFTLFKFSSFKHIHKVVQSPPLISDIFITPKRNCMR